MTFVYNPPAMPQPPTIATTPASAVQQPVPHPQTWSPPLPASAVPRELRAQTGTPTMRAMNHAEFVATVSRTPNEFLWEGVFPLTGTVLVAGAPLCGKTSLIAAVAAAAMVTTGTAQVALRAVKRRHFLFVAMEHQSQLLGHLESAARSLNVPAIDAHFLSTFDLDDESSITSLDAEAERVGAQVIVIDCLRRATTADENSSQSVGEIGRALRRLTRNDTRLVVVVHHVGHGGKVRGSTDLEAQSSSIVILTRQGSVVTARARHHGAPDHEVRFRFEFENGALAVVPVQAAQAAMGGGVDSVDEIVFGVIEAGAPSMRAIRDKARANLAATGRRGIQNSTIDAAVASLSRIGRIENVGNAHQHKWKVALGARQARMAPAEVSVRDDEDLGSDGGEDGKGPSP